MFVCMVENVSEFHVNMMIVVMSQVFDEVKCLYY